MREKYIDVNERAELIIKTLLIFSCPFFTILLSNRYSLKMILLGAIVAFGIFIYLAKKHIKIKSINKYKIILSTLIALYMIKGFLLYTDKNLSLINKIVETIFGAPWKKTTVMNILAIASIPVLTYYIYWFIENIIPKVKEFFISLTKVEKIYLFVIIVLSTIFSIWISSNTTAFSKPIYKNKVQIYDVIYTSDSGTLTKGDAYFNVSFEENDIRQPLFGLFAIPFSVMAKLISELAFFAIKDNGYLIIMTIIQFTLIAISSIMLGRIIGIEEKHKKYLYLLISCSFPFLLFGLVLEQYAIGLFYLITTIYVFFTMKENKINYAYLGAVGTMLTSGVLFPMVTKTKKLTQWLKDMFKVFCSFIVLLTIGGQFPQVLLGLKKISILLTGFTGKIVFDDRLCQFTHFIKGIFMGVEGQEVPLKAFPSYLVAPVKVVSVVGIIIFVLCILSYILNRKNKLAQISILWVAFSVIILLFIGWGTNENGLILYSLYFSWAYLVLYFLLLKKLLKNNIVFSVAIIISCSVMLYFNINELIKIIDFALKYYPVA